MLVKAMGKMRKRNHPSVIRFHKVSKLKSSEEHYLRLLQLYMPWRMEVELNLGHKSYEDKFKHVESDILCNIKKHEPYLDIELEDFDDVNIDYSEEESDNNEFSMLNPDLLDLEIENNLETVTSAATTTKDNLFLPNDQFYDMCFKLNDSQKQLCPCYALWKLM